MNEPTEREMLALVKQLRHHARENLPLCAPDCGRFATFIEVLVMRDRDAVVVEFPNKRKFPVLCIGDASC